MPHISKRRIKEKTFLRIQKQLAGALANAKSFGEANSFIKEFFTPTERIMLSKRLAAIFMLQTGASPYRVWKTLKLSPSTAERLHMRLETGAFVNICKILNHKENKKSFWDDLETLLQAGLPPRGKGRWKWFYDMQRKPTK